MKVEYIALSTVLRDLIPLKRWVKIVTTAVGVNDSNNTIKTTVWEDNQGCVILANLEPPRMNSRSKYYAIIYHWFRTELKLNYISIAPIDSTNQHTDFIIKGLCLILFAANRFRLMGWWSEWTLWFSIILIFITRYIDWCIHRIYLLIPLQFITRYIAWCILGIYLITLLFL